MGMRILVTGAAGFIGTNFLKRLKDDPLFEITGVFHHRKPVIQATNIRYVQADLRRAEDCRQAIGQVDWVCMFAGRMSTTAIMAKNPMGPVVENTILNTQMLTAAFETGVKKFLWISSTTGYPQLDRSMREDDFFIADPPPPYEPVGWMARYIEKLSLLYATKPKNPMTVIALRPSNVFGEYDDFDYETCHAMTAIMRRVIERKSPIEIWGNGKDERDYLYVDDLIDACLLVLEKIEGFASFNIGNGKSYSLNQLLEIMMRVEGYENARIVHRLEKSRDVRVRRLDCSLAQSRLGFLAKTPIENGLAATIDWFKKNRGGE